jgi:hypothetical protein
MDYKYLNINKIYERPEGRKVERTETVQIIRIIKG